MSNSISSLGCSLQLKLTLCCLSRVRKQPKSCAPRVGLRRPNNPLSWGMLLAIWKRGRPLAEAALCDITTGWFQKLWGVLIGQKQMLLWEQRLSVFCGFIYLFNVITAFWHWPALFQFHKKGSISLLWQRCCAALIRMNDAWIHLGGGWYGFACITRRGSLPFGPRWPSFWLTLGQVTASQHKAGAGGQSSEYPQLCCHGNGGVCPSDGQFQSDNSAAKNKKRPLFYVMSLLLFLAAALRWFFGG